jgi:hypothetical protein
MIRVILQGRTGNNLFQYAAGRALAHRLDTGLVLDGSWADAAHARQFEHLLRLPLKARYTRRLTIPKRLFRKYFGIGPQALHSGAIQMEPDGGGFTDLSTASDNTLLLGFFQNPRHFDHVESLLRSEFDLSRLQLPPDSLRFEENLRERTTVSIHVRRGDYLRIGNTDCLGDDYHQRAVAWFRERYEDLRFCLFSDDIPWCRNQFKENEFLFCDFEAGTQDPFHDMRLMAACAHHIIVNSSYSWWGAWLNASKGKVVIAPSQWMRGLPSQDIVPAEWISL